MATVNPYRAPSADVSDQGEEYGEIRVFSTQGRLGRVRYIGYTVGMSIVIALIGVVLGAIVGGLGLVQLAGPLGMLAGAAVLVVQLILTIQRCHDFNVTGWLSILVLIPVVGLLFWIIPGTQGENRYGLPPPPNTGGAVALALILPLVFVVGIMAAISIPAYKQYTERARAAQQR